MRVAVAAKEGASPDKRWKLSVYERYLLFDRQFSRLLAQQKIDGFNFYEDENEILFLAGRQFIVNQKKGCAIIYSKLLAETVRKKLGIYENGRAMPLFFYYKDGFYRLSLDSCKFLQTPTKK